MEQHGSAAPRHVFLRERLSEVTQGVFMAMTLSGGTKRPMVDLNVTPLIDVLLVLIITFLVVNNLPPRGLDAVAPQSSTKPGGESAIVVSVDAAGRVRINTTPVELSALGSRLGDIFKTRNTRILFVDADSKLPFGAVAKVIDIAKGANIDKIGLITQKGSRS